MHTHRWLFLIVAIGIGILGISILLSLPAAAQAPRPTPASPAVSSPDRGNPPALPESPNVVLYNQYDNSSGVGASSQNFEPAMDNYDSFLADDFVVPYNQSWSINQVDVQGVYFNGAGPADSFNIFIYTEAITLPGTLIDSRLNVTYTENSGDFSILIDTPILLNPGKYWISVQANQSFSPAGQWAWIDRTVGNNLPATWQNPGGGFGQCPTWNLRTACVAGDQTSPDQVFRLSGTSSAFIQPLTCGAGAPGPWSLRNYLPAPVYGPGVASNGTYAYVFGGNHLQAGGIVLTQTVRYDPAANGWIVLAPMPGARMMPSAVFSPVNNKIYVFGGQGSSLGPVFGSTLIYDIATNTWSAGADMPDIRAFMAGGYYNGKIYLVGGYSTGGVTPVYKQTWEYNITANTWITRTSMPEPLGGAASAVVNGHLYVIGGRDDVTPARSQTYDYDIVHDTWSSRANIPAAVNTAGAAVLDGKIWVIGGGNPFISAENSPSAAAGNRPEAYNTTWIYDAAANTWSTGPTLNVSRAFIGVTAISDLAIAVGGFNGSTSSDATEVTIDCPAVHFSAATYSVNENAGTIQIPVLLDSPSIVASSVSFFTADRTATAGTDYVAITGTLSFPPGVTSKTFNVTILNDHIFEDNETLGLSLNMGVSAEIVPPNPAVLRILNDEPAPPLSCGYATPAPWILRSFLPQPVYAPAVANDGVFAYAIGGYSFDAGGDTSQVVRYNPLANTWTLLAPAPKPVTMGSAVYSPINNKLYLFGGELVSSGAVYSSTLIYDIAHDTWSTGASMPDKRAFMSAGYFNGKIYLVGGYSTGNVNPSSAQTWEYNVLANSWTAKADMPHALGGAGSAVVNGHLFVIGGRDASNTVTNQVYNYNIAANSWSSGMNIPYAVNVPGAAVLHEKIWVIGGGAPYLGLDASRLTLDTNIPAGFNTTRIYDPKLNTWTNGPNLNIPRSFVGATGFGNFMLAIGGYSSTYATGAIEISWACPNGYLPVVVNQGP